MTAPPTPAPTHDISLREAAWVWARVAALSFGGPAGQIAVMHRILVEEKKWIGEQRFLHALNFCMLLPGPEAQQLATYIGWLLHKTKGGLIAGGLFILPGLLAIMALSIFYASYGEVGAVQALFFGLKAAILAIVLDAVRRIGARAVRTNAARLIAAAAFAAIFLFDVPFPLVILAAGILGYVGGRTGWTAFTKIEHESTDGGQQAALGSHSSVLERPSIRSSLRVAAIFLLLWIAPVAVLTGTLGSDNVFSQIAIFFSKMAVVTFGGAYAVLAYVAQQAVEAFGWLDAGEMLDGLAMAETTPGPLIMVTQYVGFMAAFREASGLPPMVAGMLGGLLTTWVTFTPCFLWIFLGAPYVESMRRNKALSSALAAITAAVVGVILNLALWFAIHSVFREVRRIETGPLAFDAPLLRSVDPAALALTLAAVIAMLRYRAGMMWVLLSCGAAGLGYRAVT